MKFGFKSLIAGSAMGILVPGAILTAASAQASTSACVNGTGAFPGYCATQISNDAHALAFTAKGGSMTYGNAINGYPVYSSGPGQDFIQFATDHNYPQRKEFVAAANGVPVVVNGSNLCISDPDDSSLGAKQDALVLRNCNNSKFQLFDPSDLGTGYFTWTNVNSSKQIKSNGQSSQLTGVTTSTTGWKFGG
jgi:hypothetical protein